jgi:hypothetical protein
MLRYLPQSFALLRSGLRVEPFSVTWASLL